MANVRQGNIWYIDSTGAAGTQRQIILKILVTPTSANSIVVLRETSSGANKMDLRAATNGQTAEFDFTDYPVVFGDGIYVQTLTNAVVMIVVSDRN